MPYIALVNLIIHILSFLLFSKLIGSASIYIQNWQRNTFPGNKSEKVFMSFTFYLLSGTSDTGIRNLSQHTF